MFDSLTVIMCCIITSIKIKVVDYAIVFATHFLFFLECEYISLIFIIIYVGAIAVLFLFAVMTLCLKTVKILKDFLKYFPFGSFIGTIFRGLYFGSYMQPRQLL